VSSEARRVTFVTRQGCDLCNEAQIRLTALAHTHRFTVEVVDVDSDEDLRTAFGELVPVVLSARGRVLATGALSGLRAQYVAWRIRLSVGG